MKTTCEIVRDLLPLYVDDVCSPAGSTIQGVRALEQNGFRSAGMEAVIEAYEKNRALGKN